MKKKISFVILRVNDNTMIMLTRGHFYLLVLFSYCHSCCNL